MNQMIEKRVSKELRCYLQTQGLTIVGESDGKFNVFDHVDDCTERTFIIDLAFKPTATKGNRTDGQLEEDRNKFNSGNDAIQSIDKVVDDLKACCEFPSEHDMNQGW